LISHKSRQIDVGGVRVDLPGALGIETRFGRLRREAEVTRERDLAEERETCEGSLVMFMARAWEEIEPGELDINWHHQEIAAALEAITAGQMRALIINQPPRTTKTLMCNVFWPAWIWAQPEANWGPLAGPHVRFLCVSYGATLSEEIAVKMRRLVTGEWYQTLWGDRVKIREDQQNRANFANTAGGERMSNSIEGGLLGRGGDIQVVDDPHHLVGAESTLQRRATLEGMRSLVTRVTDPRISARVLVMQRLHTDDATNYALENWPGVEHLCYPMRFNADIAAMQPTDPREYDGELLWPTVWTEEAVAAEERELTPYGVAGQLQQSPVPRGGGIILRDWWRLWPDDAPEAAGMDAGYRCPVCKWVGYVRAADADGIACPSCGSLATREVPFPPFSFRLLSVDTNFGEKEENSWSAATCWEVWHGKDDAPRVMLTYAWRGRPHLHATKEAAAKGDLGLVERIHKIANQRQIDLVLIEHKTRGEDLYHELARQSVEWPYRLEWFEPTGRGDKIARLNAVSGLFTADLVWAPNKAWAETVITEVCEARPGTVGDLTDTASQGLTYLRQSHLLPTTEEYTREARRALVFRGNRPGVAAEIEGGA
jgi:phage terminase large subunit-like protein